MFCLYFCSWSSLFAWFKHFSVFTFPVALPFFWIQQWVMYLCLSTQSVSHCSFHTKHYLSFTTRSHMGKLWNKLTSGKSSLLDTENASDLYFHLLCIVYFVLSEVLCCVCDCFSRCLSGTACFALLLILFIRPVLHLVENSLSFSLSLSLSRLKLKLFKWRTKLTKLTPCQLAILAGFKRKTGYQSYTMKERV